MMGLPYHKSPEGKMPRINIEEKWWSDWRRFKLNEKLGLGTGDGAWFYAVRVAQEKQGDAFDATELFPMEWIQAFLSVGLATGQPTLLYIKGSKEHHEWLVRNRQNASKGGKASHNKINQLGSSVGRAPAKRQPSGGLPSSSSSSSKNTDINKLISGSEEASPPNKTGYLISCLKHNFQKNLKRSLPPLSGKQIGVCKRLAKSWTNEQIEHYSEKFTQWRDPWITKRGHPVETLESNLEQLHAWAEGQDKHLTNLAESRFTESTIEEKLQKDVSNAKFNQFLEQSNQRSNIGIRNEIQNQGFGKLPGSVIKRDDREEFVEHSGEDDSGKGPLGF
jgi:hypothetical protein